MYPNIIESDLSSKHRAYLYYFMAYAKDKECSVTFKTLHEYMGFTNNRYITKERTRKILKELKEADYIQGFKDDNVTITVTLQYQGVMLDKFTVQSKYVRLPKKMLQPNTGKYVPILMSIYYCNNYIDTPTIKDYVTRSGYSFNTFKKYMEHLQDNDEVVYDTEEMKYYIVSN